MVNTAVRPQSPAVRGLSAIWTPPSVFGLSDFYSGGGFQKCRCFKALTAFFTAVVKGDAMEEEKRIKITVWLKPGLVSRMDGWLESDNCKSRGEFTEKALRFYMGYLASEDTSEFCPRALVDTLRGIVADNANRLRSLIFKWCVEMNMMGHTIAAHFHTAPHQPPRAARLCCGRSDAHQWSDQLRRCAGSAAPVGR